MVFLITGLVLVCYLISKEQDFMPDHFIIVNGQQFIENKYQTKEFIASFNIQRLEFENEPQMIRGEQVEAVQKRIAQSAIVKIHRSAVLAFLCFVRDRKESSVPR